MEGTRLDLGVGKMALTSVYRMEELQTRGRDTTAKRQLQLSAGPKEGRTMTELMEGKECL